MKIIEIIKNALTILKREDILEAWEAAALSAEQSEVVKLLLFCVNSVEDELARHHLPLRQIDEVEPKNGKVYMSDLSKQPLRIFNIFSGEERIRYQRIGDYLIVRGKKVTIEYEYVPSKSGGFDDDSIYTGTIVGENLIAAGAAAEFYLLQGDIEMSEYWDKRYHTLINGAKRVYTFCRYVEPRLWI